MSTKVMRTRSQRLEEMNTLDTFFNQKKEDVSTFYDALSGSLQGSDSSPRDDVIRKIVSGKPDRISVPKKMGTHVSGFVRIICGPHRDDYVWHVEPAAIRRPWKTTNERIIFIIAKIMHGSLPDIEAKIWPPQQDWELRTITFKALGLVNEWSFNEALVEKINHRLFEALNPLV